MKDLGVFYANTNILVLCGRVTMGMGQTTVGPSLNQANIHLWSIKGGEQFSNERKKNIQSQWGIVS